MTNEQVEELKIQVGELLSLLHPIEFDTVCPNDEIYDELVFQIDLVGKLVRDAN